MDSIKEFIVEHKKSLKEALVVINKNGLPNFTFKGRKKNIPSNLAPWFKKENN